MTNNNSAAPATKGIDLEVSFMQALGIILVVAEHSFNYYDEPPYFCDWVYQFSMPMFVFLSGYLLKHGMIRKNQSSADIRMGGRGGFIFDKTKRLLVPYFIINTLVFIPKALLGSFSLRPVELSFADYFDMLAYPYHNVVGTLWFLFTIFTILVIAVIGLKLLNKLKFRIHPLAILAALAAVSVLAPKDEIIFNIHAIMRYMVYMAAGYYARSINLKEKIANRATAIFNITFILSFFLAFAHEYQETEIITAANGIMMMMSAAIIYNKKGWHLINHLYGASYTIYIYSWFAQVFFLQILMKLTGLPGFAASILAIAGGVYIPFLLHKWIKANRTTAAGKCLAFISGIK